MPVTLTRQSWEAHKDKLVTGKGLSDALSKYAAAQAAADNEDSEDTWKAVHASLRVVSEEIKKNQAKVEKSKTATHTTLTQLLTLAQAKFKEAGLKGAAAVSRHGAINRVSEYEKTIAPLASKAQAGAGALAKLKKDVDGIIATPAAQNPAAKKKLHDHLEATVFRPYAAAYVEVTNGPGTIRDIIQMYPAGSFNDAQKATLKGVTDNMNKIRAFLGPIRDGMQAQLDRLK